MITFLGWAMFLTGVALLTSIWTIVLLELVTTNG